MPLYSIVGAPDSGATPLLNVLAGRQQGGELQATILYDGKSRDQSFLRKVGYVQKTDVHLPHLTVFETLYFSARQRCPASMPDKIIKLRVKAVLKLLGLLHVSNGVVGDAHLKGISGGEKRRLSIGVEWGAGHSMYMYSPIADSLLHILPYL
jgi:ABC-type multidrug transport system ATPase subunit